MLVCGQQLSLRRGRQVADLGEEEGPATRRLECAFARSIGAGERTTLMSEQLALHELMGQCGAVDRDKRSFGVGAEAMQLPGDELFARATFTDDQRCARHRRDADDRLLEFGERGTQAYERGFEPKAAPEQRDLFTEAPAVDRVLHFLRHTLHRLRLMDEALGPE